MSKKPWELEPEEISSGHNLVLYTPLFGVQLSGLSRTQAFAASIIWILLTIVATIAIIYAYAVWFAGIVGFETALLVGVGIIALAVMGD